MLHTANILRAAEIHAWGRDTATVWLFPPGEGGARLTLAHLKKGGPTYDDALSQLTVPGPLLLMLPTDPPFALHRELEATTG